MTIAAGFVVSDGVLLCADTLWSDGETKDYRDKIFSWHGKRAVVSFAVAGNSDNARSTVDECRVALQASRKTTLSSPDVIRIIKPVIRRAWTSHVDSRPWEEREVAMYQLLIAISASAQAPRLFRCTGTTPAAVDSFECVGSGKPLARYCIESSYRRNLTVDEAAVLGILALAATKQHMDGIGGKSQFTVVRKGFASGIVPHDVNQSEHLALEYKRRATNLLLDIADGQLDEDELRERILEFSNFAQDLRKEWLDKASPYRELRDCLQKRAGHP